MPELADQNGDEEADHAPGPAVAAVASVDRQSSGSGHLAKLVGALGSPSMAASSPAWPSPVVDSLGSAGSEIFGELLEGGALPRLCRKTPKMSLPGCRAPTSSSRNLQNPPFTPIQHLVGSQHETNRNDRGHAAAA